MPIIFEVTTAGKETVLYNFCSQPGCVDGSYTSAGLLRDSAGNLYGTTFYGGASGDGTVFKLTP
ncbi:MAG: choice-of-anchor tandem repeat GloVer-containing protein [Terriglobales bacterium]